MIFKIVYFSLHISRLLFIFSLYSLTNSTYSAAFSFMASISDSSISVLHQLDQKIIYPHYDFKHLTEKYFEIGMKLNDFSIQLVKYCISLFIFPGTPIIRLFSGNFFPSGISAFAPTMEFFPISAPFRNG